MDGAGPSHSLQLHPSLPPTLLAGAQKLGSSSAAFQGALERSWIGIGMAGFNSAPTWDGSIAGCRLTHCVTDSASPFPIKFNGGLFFIIIIELHIKETMRNPRNMIISGIQKDITGD